MLSDRNFASLLDPHLIDVLKTFLYTKVQKTFPRGICLCWLVLKASKIEDMIKLMVDHVLKTVKERLLEYLLSADLEMRLMQLYHCDGV